MARRISNRNKFFLVGSAAAAGVGIIWLIKHRSQNPRWMAAWQLILAECGEDQARQLTGRVYQRYQELLRERPMPSNLMLQQHLRDHILPGLALYQVLLAEHGGDQKAALAEVDKAFRAQALRDNRLLAAPFKLVRDPFHLLKMIFPFMMKTYPGEGWDFEYVENSSDRIAFNATRCFYLNTLKSYGAPELCASFCATDDVQAELFPAQIQFVRDHTMGRGDELCDFQYYRVK
jgi:hypothetical protein